MSSVNSCKLKRPEFFEQIWHCMTKCCPEQRERAEIPSDFFAPAKHCLRNCLPSGCELGSYKRLQKREVCLCFRAAKSSAMALCCGFDPFSKLFCILLVLSGEATSICFLLSPKRVCGFTVLPPLPNNREKI